MEIKKFEAYNYRGPSIDKIDRKKFLEETFDLFSSGEFLGYDVNGTSYSLIDEILYIYLAKERKDGIFYDDRVIKLDFSDVGIEIGTQEWDEETEDFKDFIPDINLDTDITKQIKKYKKDIKNYNL